MQADPFLYRGVHGRHPALELAMQGIVKAGNPVSLMTAEEHNLLDLPELSPFTSWTRSRNRAVAYAQRYGPGGVLLRVREGSPTAVEDWSWEYSPDFFGEQEVLLRGVRVGVEVIPV